MKKIRWSRLSLISIVLLFSTLTSEIHQTVLKDENTQLNELRKKLQNHVKLSDINEGTLVRKINKILKNYKNHQKSQKIIKNQ